MTEIVFGVITETNYIYSPGRRAAKKPYFSPIPLLLTGFRLISIQQWLKTSFARKKGILSDQPEKKLYFFSRMRKCQNLDFCFFCESISIFLSLFPPPPSFPSLLMVLLPTLSSLLCMELWLANFLGKGQI